MSRWSDNLQMYWAHAVGTVLLAIVVWSCLPLHNWETILKPLGVAVFGYVCVIASHEVADWTGRYGWTYQSFWSYPPTYVRFAGFALLLGVLLFGF